MSSEPSHLEPDTEAVKEIFADACDVPDPQRQRVLDQRCGLDDRLRAKVEDLLRAHETAGRFMSDPAATVQKLGGSEIGEDHAEELPRYINRFKLIRLLGQGGFGAVYLAEQEHPVRRTVAFKIIKLGMDTRQVIARFEAERQALAVMDHPNIARVFDAGATDTGRPYFVMELVDGVPITEFCRTNGLSIRQRVELFVPVCLAVAHAHQKGIIHRDIKPSNVLVARQDPGAAGVPKVIDFGVAKATAAPLADATAYTGIRQLIGTLEYMSPEQADLNHPSVDTRSDIYSLGVLLYELLAGTTPFDRERLRDRSYSDAQRILREVQPVRPSSRVTVRGADSRAAPVPRPMAGSIRGDLDWVVMKCLEKDRERRYPSAAELAEDLKRHLAGEPVFAGPATAAYRIRKFVGRHKAAVGSIAGIAIALIVAVVGTSSGLLHARKALHRAEVAEQVAKDQRSSAEEARRRAERNAAAATREAQRAATMSAFLRDVFALAEPESGSGGQEANVDDVLRRAAGEIDRLADRPEEQLLARRMLGEACSRIFLHDLAVQQLRLAHDLSATMSGGARSARSLDIATELAMAMYLARRGDEAAPMARATVADCRRELGMRHPVTWEAMQAAALCASETGSGNETYALLKELIENVRPLSTARRSDALGRYLCNWSICLRDRGEFEAASAALREAAALFRDEEALSTSKAPVTAPADDFSAARLRLLEERSPYMINASGWVVRAMVESGLPEVLPMIERNIARGLTSYPRGTPTIGYRLEDVANLRLRSGDFAGAAAALRRGIEMSRGLRGFDGEPEQSRWRMWMTRCNPDLTRSWRSPALRNQVFCALDDMLRDFPPARLVPEEMPVNRLRFKLTRWAEDAAQVVAEGGLDQLRSLPDPPMGLYLLALDVPRLGTDPLRKANWLLLVPWSVEFRPIVRYDALRTDNSPNGRDWTGVLASRAYARRQMLGLALNDGLALTTEKPERLQWLTAVATARADFPVGRYRLSATSDDGVRVFIDGQRVLNDWTPRPSGTSDAEVQLTAGSHDLRVDLFQETGGYCLWLQVMPLTSAAKAAGTAAGGGVPGADWRANGSAQLTSEYPREPRYPMERADALAHGGRFPEAAIEYAKLVDHEPTNSSRWYTRAMLVGYLADRQEYQRTCREIFDRFSASTDPVVVARVLLACLVRPELPVDPEQFRQLVKRAEATEAPAVDAPLFALARGLAEYRADRGDAGVQSLQNALALAPPIPEARAAAKIALAMADHHLGRDDEARASLADIQLIMQTQVRHAGVEDLTPVGVENWLLCQTLWSEAEPLMRH